MTDEAFVQAFEAGTLEPAAFPHRAHVRLAWLYLRQYPLAEAAARITAGIRAFAAAVGKPEKYHETITWAYLLIIQDRVARASADAEAGGTAAAIGGAPDFDRFAEANGDLLLNGRALLERWYHPATLDAPLARQAFVWPDRMPATDGAGREAARPARADAEIPAPR